MPRLSRLRVRVLEELAHELRFAPPEAARKHLVRAEELAAEVLGDLAGGRVLAYPRPWVLFRLTGLTGVAVASGDDEPETIAAEALLADLSALVERLCVAAKLTVRDTTGGPGAWLGVPELCERWGVTRKTIERHRRAGLIARRVLVGKGRARLLFSEKTVRAFEAAQTRRAPERRGTGSGDVSAQPPRRRRSSREALDQLEDGVSLSEIARETSRSRSNVQRLALSARADRLVSILPLLAPAKTHEPFVADLLRRQARVLAAEPARRGLGAPLPIGVDAILDAAASHGVILGAVERARAEAYACLKARAHAAILALPRERPRVQDQQLDDGSIRLGLDRIETDLRWAARLKVELVRQELPLVVRTVENVLAPITLRSLPPAMAEQVMGEALAQAVEAVEHFDVSKGGRLAAPVGLAVTRAATTWRRTHAHWLSAHAQGKSVPTGTRAVAVPRSPDALDAVARGGGPSSDLARRVCPWQAWLEPPVPDGLAWDELADDARRVLICRMGWADPSTGESGEAGGGGGGEPRTLDETAEVLGISRTKTVRLEKAAYAALRAHAAG